jgi:hypothetical protein
MIKAPPEHAAYFSEAVVIMPSTYQVSSYDHTINEDTVDKTYASDNILISSSSLNIPDSGDRKIFRLCNFNKIDKIDPESFHVWMNVSSAICYYVYVHLLTYIELTYISIPELVVNESEKS